MLPVRFQDRAQAGAAASVAGAAVSTGADDSVGVASVVSTALDADSGTVVDPLDSLPPQAVATKSTPASVSRNKVVGNVRDPIMRATVVTTGMPQEQRPRPV